jgi:hypothetical protein
MIKKGPKGYSVKSHSGKNLGGPYKSEKEAHRRMNQVEMFKHMKGRSVSTRGR